MVAGDGHFITIPTCGAPQAQSIKVPAEYGRHVMHGSVLIFGNITCLPEIKNFYPKFILCSKAPANFIKISLLPTPKQDIRSSLRQTLRKIIRDCFLMSMTAETNRMSHFSAELQWIIKWFSTYLKTRSMQPKFSVKTPTSQQI